MSQRSPELFDELAKAAIPMVKKGEFKAQDLANTVDAFGKVSHRSPEFEEVAKAGERWHGNDTSWKQKKEGASWSNPGRDNWRHGGKQSSDSGRKGGGNWSHDGAADHGWQESEWKTWSAE